MGSAKHASEWDKLVSGSPEEAAFGVVNRIYHNITRQVDFDENTFKPRFARQHGEDSTKKWEPVYSMGGARKIRMEIKGITRDEFSLWSIGGSTIPKSLEPALYCCFYGARNTAEFYTYAWMHGELVGNSFTAWEAPGHISDSNDYLARAIEALRNDPYGEDKAWELIERRGYKTIKINEQGTRRILAAPQRTPEWHARVMAMFWRLEHTFLALDNKAKANPSVFSPSAP